MLQSKSSQFTLGTEGKIFWQEKVNNPLDGVEIAILAKGETPLSPVINIIDNEHTAPQDQTMLRNHLSLWLREHFMVVLEKLALLETPIGAKSADDPVSRIAQKLYANLGVIPREDVQSDIDELTEEHRAELRAKNIRLGPILVFMPSLNKPAAVRLRALLWCLYNDRTLPAQIPADGIVSVRVSEDQLKEDAYYRAISYPLYGGRAIRIDMLDRMLNTVYEVADKGKFQAQHQMAEWLGATIEDLYKVLEDMGHTKIHDPAEQKEKEQSAGEAEKEPDTASDEKPEESSVDNIQAVDAKTSRPELATFRLKAGRANERKSSGGARAQKKSGQGKPFTDTKKTNDMRGKAKNKKKPYDKNKKQNAPRMMSAEAKNKKEEDSPFAILQQLKK